MNADQYKESQLQRVLAEDERISELGLRVSHLEDNEFALSGEVESPKRKEIIEQVVHERFPDLRVQTDIGVTRVNEPAEVEEV